MWALYCTVVIGVIFVTGDASFAPHDIRIDYYRAETTNDLVVQTGRPHFSWKLSRTRTSERNVRQIAYQMQILSANAVLWDSDRVNTSQSIHVPFPFEKDLEELTHYQVRLRLWTSTASTAWTAWIPFRTSIYNFHQYVMDRNDEVYWIGSTQIYMNELRKEFNVSITSQIRSAIAFVSGIGYYEMYLNGENVDPSRKLDPGWTSYQKRTLFVSFDVTSKIRAGMNAVGIKLGNGWYSQEQYLLPAIPEPKYGRTEQPSSESFESFCA